MNRNREPRWLLFGSLALAVVLGLVPLPELVAPFRPYWVALVLAYWSLESPDRVGLGTAFAVGLLADVVHGSLLGEQALRLVILVFLVLRFRPRLRFFPLSQQALALFALLLNDRVVVAAVRAFTGEGWPPALFWVSPLVGMLLWPWIFLLLDDLRLRQRGREG
jgi:rod shape-determining protein MreD